MGLAGATALITLCAFALTFAWQWAGGGRMLAWMIMLAFALRLGVGLVTSVGLPAWGLIPPSKKAGICLPMPTCVICNPGNWARTAKA